MQNSTSPEPVSVIFDSFAKFVDKLDTKSLQCRTRRCAGVSDHTTTSTKCSFSTPSAWTAWWYIWRSSRTPLAADPCMNSVQTLFSDVWRTCSARLHVVQAVLRLHQWHSHNMSIYCTVSWPMFIINGGTTLDQDCPQSSENVRFCLLDHVLRVWCINCAPSCILQLLESIYNVWHFVW